MYHSWFFWENMLLYSNNCEIRVQITHFQPWKDFGILMRLVLDGITAYEYWMLYNNRYAHGTDIMMKQRLTSFEKVTSTELGEAIAKNEGKPGPMHLLVESAKDRRRSKWFSCHVWSSSTPLPPNSIHNIGPSLYVESPELCMVRLAATIPRYELYHKVSNMLGLFAFDFWERMSLVEREPITTIESAKAYLQMVPHARGVRALRQALTSVSERCRSPRESTLALLLKMPTRLGGQSLPPFEVNARLNLSNDARPLTTRRYLEGDVVWRSKNAVLEYNSDEWHLDAVHIMTDMEKIATLQRMGVTVFPMTTRQFDDYEAFETIIQGIRNALGVRDRDADLVRGRRQLLHYDLMEIERTEREEPVLSETSRWKYLAPRLDVADS